MADKDLYAILGINKNASADEIKSAYRSLAKKYHPDLYATASESEKKAAESKFKEIQHAYEVLSDPQKKAAYDQYGSEDGPTMNGFGGNGGGFGGFTNFSGEGFDGFFSNIFDAFTGGNRGATSQQEDGADVECKVNLSFKEAVFGVKDKEIVFNRMEKCSTCNGTGSKSPNGVTTCSKCKGTGTITILQRSFFGNVQTRTTCDQCRGTGKIIIDKCPDCLGKGIRRAQRKLKINVPAGVDNNNTMTIRGEGCAAPNGSGTAGDLYLRFIVAPHTLFVREGVNVSFELPITIFQAALGAKIAVPMLDGSSYMLDIPEGTQNGTVLRIRGKGIKNLRKEAYGDMYVHIVVEVPKSLNLKQRNALRDISDEMAKAKYDKVERFNKIIKDL